MGPFIKIGELFPGTVCTYAGTIRGRDDQPDAHLLLLSPGSQFESMNWVDANDLAAFSGAKLPTKAECAILRANVPEFFGEYIYWTADHVVRVGGPDEREIVGAWSFGMKSGNEQTFDIHTELRVALVRRALITGEM